MSLPVVTRAVGEDVLGPVAARTLLDLVARRVGNSQNVRAAPALTGVDPPDTRRGVRGEPGPSLRQHRAGAILGGLSERTVRKHQHRYFEEYAGAVLTFLRAVVQHDRLLEAYLIQCGVSIQPGVGDEHATRLAGVLTPASPVPATRPSLPNHLSPMVATHVDDSLRVRLARGIPSPAC